MKNGCIGIRNVGFAIADHPQKKGHEIIIGNNGPDSQSVKKAVSGNPSFKVKGIREALNISDLVFLVTPFRANEAVLKEISFNGKTLVDCTIMLAHGSHMD